MKSLRHIALTVILTVSAFSAVTYTSCNKDQCADVICKNGATCTDGFCTCPTGFTGVNCQTSTRLNFEGVYIGKDQCTVGDDEYAVKINKTSDATKLTLSNIYNATFTAFCTITSDNTFTFQGSSNNNVYSGTGTLSNSQLTLTYSVTSGAITNTCTFTGVSK